jgi:hypothetical protein
MRPTCGLGLLLLLCAAPLRAQDGEVRGALEVGVGAQELARDPFVTIGARLWLHLDDDWALGFGGFRGLAGVKGGDLEGSGLEATFGAGELFVRRRVPWAPDLAVALALGSGSLALENRTTGTNVDTEAVWLAEPTVQWSGGVVAGFRLGAEVGYRLAFGVDDLTRLDAGAFRTIFVNFTARIPSL